MPKICYIPKTFPPDRLVLIQYIDNICLEYQAMNFDMTLRQVYYQLVSRNMIPEAWHDPVTGPNNERAYDNLGSLVNDARLAGLIDWDHIVDITRYVEQNSHWVKPSDLILSAAKSYLNNKWLTQPHYVEVWIEKDALKSVLSRACSKLDVPFFSCRGYTSSSAMWAAGMRIAKQAEAGKICHIVHLGDHDPSGIDMSRDIKARLQMFMAPHSVHVLRAALNMFQIQRLHPPPNPAKFSDSRAKDYVAKYGRYSWELDAIPPQELVALVNRAVGQYIDQPLWKEAKLKEDRGRKTLQAMYDRFDEVVKFLRGQINGR